MSIKELRVNQQIKVREVRLIDSDGKMVGIVPIEVALESARQKGLDLVEIVPNQSPPVCKIIDYGKYKYQEKKKAQAAKAKQTIVEIKEIKLRPRTEDHDLQFKIAHIRRFIQDGNKAKVTIVFRGREMQHIEIAQPMVNKIIKETEDIAKVEVPPKLEGRSIVMLLTKK
ncbi:MAG: translation initiation factor IF-3 [Deltaproteobacteria bacterium]|nr:translation initiation factor IF-3 [Deltaproteobacteria bacterium]